MKLFLLLCLAGFLVVTYPWHVNRTTKRIVKRGCNSITAWLEKS